MSTIFSRTFNTPFESVPFNSIPSEAYEQEIKQTIAAARNEVDAIADNTATPDFENTVAALERSGRSLSLASAAFFNLTSAETNDILEKTKAIVSPLLAAFGNDITLNEKLFHRIKAVYDQRDTFSLIPEEKRLLDKTYKRFVRNGALLSAVQKEKLRNIDQELANLTVKFSQHVLQETNNYFLHITNKEELRGLPDSILQMAAAEAGSRNLEGWVFTLQFPSYVPFMTYAANRERRKELYLANARKAFGNNERNNESIVKRIVALRQERANVLGFTSHADFVLQERMASSPEIVTDFLNDLLQKAKPFAIKDIEQLKSLAAADGINELMAYDHSYYAEKLREAKYNYAEEEIKPYFSLPLVQQAAFDAAGKLYGLHFKKRDDIAVYHSEVEVYEVLENGAHKALLYTDWFPRNGKRAGAWMTSFRGQYIKNNINHRPHISMVGNFSRPNGDMPSLLTFNEVTTLFHEFGHALHGILADTVYESLSGTSVYWDFVELPSQFMENYCYEKSFLGTFAKHYQTGTLLPEEKIDKIAASASFMEGYQTLRQLSFGILDMAYHSNRFNDSDSIEAFEKATIQQTVLYPNIEGTALSPSFSHVFAGGYAAGYYSYKWSEVLDADAFEAFKEKGIFDTATAAKFKTLLSKGGTEDPMDLYLAFRGRKPNPEALLRRAGLLIQ
ncbi:peptidase M3 [Terrimonas sp.]|uniref:M3 family metallopeptidase n=1 Tax=Terrimonas sp. TaxID=1914338 RepID=UPI000D50FC98|nr:M3 family metallopeptidase [Terrimonas sp.]PVD53816.1 peptidase M3 [Terrimonas sp.]